ncbi:MAG: Omp28-related outer membrane protein [Vicingaceae bacterium]
MKKTLSLFSACLVTVGLFAQLPVSTSPSNRNVLLEDLTGIYCGYCPDGALKADQLKASAPSQIIIIGNHAGSYATPNGSPGHWDFRTPEGAAINSNSDPSGYPAGNINREVTNYSMKAGKTAMSRGYWATVAGQIITEPSPANLAVEAYYYPGSNKLMVNVEGYYTSNGTGSDYLTVAVLQDDIEGYQSGMSGYPARITTNNLYLHKDVLRKYLTSPVFGEEVSTTSMGELFTWSQEYTVAQVGDVMPDITKMKVAVWLTEDAGYSPVITAVETNAAERPVGINEAASLNNLSIFPNPFQNNTTISFDLDKDQQIAMNFYDVTGKVVQQVASTNYSAGAHLIQFDGSDLQGGLYYVNIVAEDGIITRRIVLNK